MSGAAKALFLMPSPRAWRYTDETIMTPHQILWIYIGLLVIGGLIGFFKAKSKVSLIMSLAFAAALAFCALDVVFKGYVTDALLGALAIVFAIRTFKTKKFMPAGLMLVLTLAMLAVWNIKPQ